MSGKNLLWLLSLIGVLTCFSFTPFSTPPASRYPWGEPVRVEYIKCANNRIIECHYLPSPIYEKFLLTTHEFLDPDNNGCTVGGKGCHGNWGVAIARAE